MTSKFQKPGGRNIEPSADHCHRDDGKREISGEVHVRGEIEANFPPTLLEQYTTSSKQADEREERNERRDVVRFRVEVITLVFVAIVGFLSVVQVFESEAARKNSVRFFRTDERAWVKFGSVEKQAFAANSINNVFVKDVPGFRYTIYPKNFGKTIAKNLRIQILQTRGDRATGSNKPLVTELQDQTLGKDEILWSPQTLSPGETVIVPIPIFGYDPYPPIQAALNSEHNNQFSYFIGRINYTSAFGADHWVRFCYVVANIQGDLQHCEFGNEEDSNPEPEP